MVVIGGEIKKGMSRGIPWPQTGATDCHEQLGLPLQRLCNQSVRIYVGDGS